MRQPQVRGERASSSPLGPRIIVSDQLTRMRDSLSGMPIGSASAARSPLMHPALSTSLSRSFGLNSPFSLSALSNSLTHMSNSPSFSNMGMSLGRSFEERPKLEAQFFKNFTCCGLDLKDLHGLLEHFEECHVAVDDDGAGDSSMDVDMGNASDGTISGPPSPRMLQHRQQHDAKKSGLQFEAGTASPASQALQLDGGMELDMEMDDEAPVNAAPQTATFPAPALTAFDSAALQAGLNKKKFSTAMNPNTTPGAVPAVPAAASRNASVYHTPDSSVPASPSQSSSTAADIPVGVDGIYTLPTNPTATTLPGNVGLAPSLLFPGTPAGSPPSDSGASAHGSAASSGAGSKENTPAIAPLGPNSLASVPTPSHPLGQGVQISMSGRPYTPPSEKPFKCNVPGCDKAYKQQNGLKYHRLHGHCNQNALNKDGSDPRSEGKPYVCHVVSCGKRYKNMNGLRYHYQHSGAHGALGLQMLAQGTHPPPQFPPGHRKHGTGSANTSRASSPASSIATATGQLSRQSSPTPYSRASSVKIA